MVFGLAIVLVVAKIGASVASRIGQPEVLCELLLGVLLGNNLETESVGITARMFKPSNERSVGGETNLGRRRHR